MTVFVSTHFELSSLPKRVGHSTGMLSYSSTSLIQGSPSACLLVTFYVCAHSMEVPCLGAEQELYPSPKQEYYCKL